jgi:nucleotide-binding universal stress UspA family protein
MKFMVAFSSPRRSSAVVTAAARHALTTGAELILVRVLPDAEKVGVVAQLIASERPQEKAHKQMELVVSKLKELGLSVRSEIRMGEVATGICAAAGDLAVDLLFVGTDALRPRAPLRIMRDPVVQYLVDNCPVSVVLIRGDDPAGQPGILENDTEIER